MTSNADESLLGNWAPLGISNSCGRHHCLAWAELSVRPISFLVRVIYDLYTPVRQWNATSHAVVAAALTIGNCCYVAWLSLSLLLWSSLVRSLDRRLFNDTVNSRLKATCPQGKISQSHSERYGGLCLYLYLLQHIYHCFSRKRCICKDMLESKKVGLTDFVLVDRLFLQLNSIGRVRDW